MSKKLITIIIVIIIIIVAAIFSLTPKDSSNNILIYTKDAVPGTKDLKLIGYFSENELQTYELSYYVEYDNDEYAKNDYNRLIDNNSIRNDIKYNYSVEKNRLYTKIEYIIQYMSADTLNSVFGTTSSSITKEQFKNYAKQQGYIEQK